MIGIQSILWKFRCGSWNVTGEVHWYRSDVSIHPGVHSLLEQRHCRGPQKVPSSIPQPRYDQPPHVITDMLTQIILKEITPQKLLQCLTAFLIIKLFPTPNPGLLRCSLNAFILNLWLTYETQSLNTSPFEIQKGTLPELKKASLDPTSSKCLPDGLWAFDTQTTLRTSHGSDFTHMKPAAGWRPNHGHMIESSKSI